MHIYDLMLLDNRLFVAIPVVFGDMQQAISHIFTRREYCNIHEKIALLIFLLGKRKEKKCYLSLIKCYCLGDILSILGGLFWTFKEYFDKLGYLRRYFDNF